MAKHGRLTTSADGCGYDRKLDNEPQGSQVTPVQGVATDSASTRPRLLGGTDVAVACKLAGGDTHMQNINKERRCAKMELVVGVVAVAFPVWRAVAATMVCLQPSCACAHAQHVRGASEPRTQDKFTVCKPRQLNICDTRPKHVCGSADHHCNALGRTNRQLLRWYVWPYRPQEAMRPMSSAPRRLEPCKARRSLLCAAHRALAPKSTERWHWNLSLLGGQWHVRAPRTRTVARWGFPAQIWRRSAPMPMTRRGESHYGTPGHPRPQRCIVSQTCSNPKTTKMGSSTTSGIAHFPGGPVSLGNGESCFAGQRSSLFAFGSPASDARSPHKDGRSKDRRLSSPADRAPSRRRAGTQRMQRSQRTTGHARPTCEERHTYNETSCPLRRLNSGIPQKPGGCVELPPQWQHRQGRCGAQPTGPAALRKTGRCATRPAQSSAENDVRDQQRRPSQRRRRTSRLATVPM